MKSALSIVALQHTPSVLHESSRRRALTSYAGEKKETPTNSICSDLHHVLIRICSGSSKADGPPTAFSAA